LLISGYKVLGSAQRRGPAGLLQHGSLLLGASRAAPELPGIYNLTSRAIDLDELIDDLATKLAAVCGVNWNSGALDSGEQSAANRSLVEKFASIHWTAKR
jgi:lipoate-protein ligase A